MIDTISPLTIRSAAEAPPLRSTLTAVLMSLKPGQAVEVPWNGRGTLSRFQSNICTAVANVRQKKALAGKPPIKFNTRRSPDRSGIWVIASEP